MQVVTQTAIDSLPLVSRGKVRDIYAVDDDKLLLVTTDRLSAFDVILPDPIPFKGVILNQITIFWMRRFEHLVKNHLIAVDTADFPAALAPYKDVLEGRSVLVKRAKPLPIECIVRGYITGSGLADYQRTGTVCGHELPKGLRESEILPKAIFTPSTKAELGSHDENITVEQAMALAGPGIGKKAEELALAIYTEAAAYAATKGILIADTKFEFGQIGDEVILIDEVLTPDSSRFWPAASYQVGQGQPSFDKQFVRDWLSSIGFNKKPPAPNMPAEIIEKTKAKYLEAYEALTGQRLPV